MRAVQNFKVFPLVVEAYGLLLSTSFCKHAGINNLIFEGDSLQVVQQLQFQLHSREVPWSQTGFFIQNTINLLNSFCSWSIKHFSKIVNEVAHLFARFSLTLWDDMYDFNSIPGCISDLVRLDDG